MWLIHSEGTNIKNSVSKSLKPAAIDIILLYHDIDMLNPKLYLQCHVYWR